MAANLRTLLLALGLAGTALYGAWSRSQDTTAGTIRSEAWTSYATGSSCLSRLPGSSEPLLPPTLARDTSLLCGTFVTTRHSALSRTPLWSASVLTRSSLDGASAIERASEFREDHRLAQGSRAQLDDYRRSGWDRGHLAPSADMPDMNAQEESFLLSNIAPQAPRLNRGPWADLERDVRNAARLHGTAYVVTGIRFEGSRIRQTPSGHVLVPTHFWKAVHVPGAGSVVHEAANRDDGRPVPESLASFSARTGIVPFPSVPTDRMLQLEDAR